MRKLRAIGSHPFTGGIVAAMTACAGGLSWAGLFPASSSPQHRLRWLAVWFPITVGMAAWGYIAWYFRWRSLVDPKAKIVFDSSDDNHVQHGLVDIEGKSAGSKSSCDEYIYALGIVSMCAKPVSGCRLILEKSTPHNTSEQRQGRRMRIRDDPDAQSVGDFTLNPGDGQHPGVYVEVLQEIVPHQGAPFVAAELRLQYANTQRAQENWFTNRGEHTLTFRLEGDFARPVRYCLSVGYDDKRRRWRVEPAAGGTYRGGLPRES